MKNKRLKIILPAAIICVTLVVAVVVFFAVPGGQGVSVRTDVNKQKSPLEQPAKTYNFSEPELRKMVEEIAKKRFGDDAFVMFLSPEGTSEVVIEGIKREVYIYAADSMSERDKNGEVRGIYHVDANTGEIFDNGSGTMEKVSGE